MLLCTEMPKLGEVHVDIHIAGTSHSGLLHCETALGDMLLTM
jgi:hypothetical protein